MSSHSGYRHVPDYDRCGWGTAWGCKEFLDLDADVSIVLNAADPEDVFDNGHRLFHTTCLPVSAVSPPKRRTLMDIGVGVPEGRHRGYLRAV